MERRKSHVVKAGKVAIGGDNPITVQSMLNIPASDVEGNVRQAKQLEAAGAEILRVAIPNMQAVRLVEAIKSEISVPLVADIHFDYKLALECVSAGIDKIRINPGNIGGDDHVKAVATACGQKNIPIRIGVNSGSLQKEILEKYGHPCAEALCESALLHASLLEKFDFHDIVLSLKSSNVQTMVRAYELAAEACEYPLHLGVTEPGTAYMGTISSAAGIGSLLLHGIGDTIRVSLTADPTEEVRTGLSILQSVGARTDRPRLVSCPTCGRTEVDLIGMATEVEKRLQTIKKPITVAVMGCIVNGPGEAKEADIGLAGGKGKAVLFKHGEMLRTVDEKDAVSELMKEIEQLP